MLLVQHSLKKSKVHGIGVFAEEPIPKGTIMWRFTPGFDVKFTKQQVLTLPEDAQKYLCMYGWKSKKSKRYCVAFDAGKHVNHSEDPNCRSVYVDSEDEVVTVALRDIRVGEEILEDYTSLEDENDVHNLFFKLREKYYPEESDF
jgi:SET domain-containing protein